MANVTQIEPEQENLDLEEAHRVVQRFLVQAI